MIDWQFTLTVFALVVGLATLWLVFIQVQIMRTQQNIMQRQDELMALQFSRRAELKLKVDFKVLKQEDKSIRGYTFTFHVHNQGNKTAADHYWHILVPLDFSQLQRMDISENSILRASYTELESLKYSYYTGFTSEPVYPTRTKLIGEITLGTIPLDKALVVLWKIVAEDGAFPDDDYAELDVPLVDVNQG